MIAVGMKESSQSKDDSAHSQSANNIGKLYIISLLVKVSTSIRLHSDFIYASEMPAKFLYIRIWG